MPDTSLFIQHPKRLDEMVLADDLRVTHIPLHLVVPIAVIDELDDLKESRSNARHRARLTLALLDRALPGGIGRGQIREEDYEQLDVGGIPRGRVTAEILFDLPGHVRLPILDDEIIDRGLAVQAFAARPVTLLTYDTGQSTRARAAGLDVLKLVREDDTESHTG